jgi:hypothetical protein
MEFLVQRITELPVEGQKPIESIRLNTTEQFEEESSFDEDEEPRKSGCCS